MKQWLTSLTTRTGLAKRNIALYGSYQFVYIGQQSKSILSCSFRFNLVDDSSKERKPRKRRIIISHDSDWEGTLKLFFWEVSPELVDQ